MNQEKPSAKYGKMSRFGPDEILAEMDLLAERVAALEGMIKNLDERLRIETELRRVDKLKILPLEQAPASCEHPLAGPGLDNEIYCGHCDKNISRDEWIRTRRPPEPESEKVWCEHYSSNAHNHFFELVSQRGYKTNIQIARTNDVELKFCPICAAPRPESNELGSIISFKPSPAKGRGRLAEVLSNADMPMQSYTVLAKAAVDEMERVIDNACDGIRPRLGMELINEIKNIVRKELL